MKKLQKQNILLICQCIITSGLGFRDMHCAFFCAANVTVIMKPASSSKPTQPTYVKSKYQILKIAFSSQTFHDMLHEATDALFL